MRKVYTDPYFHAIGGFNLKVDAEFSSTDCCVYKVVGGWDIMIMNGNAHSGKEWEEWRKTDGKTETDPELW